MTLRAALLCLLALLQPMAARAHALDPGYLELSAMGGDRWRVTWRMPDVDGRPMAITPALPAQCTAEPAPPPHFDGRGWSTVSLAACPGASPAVRSVSRGLRIPAPIRWCATRPRRAWQ